MDLAKIGGYLIAIVSTGLFLWKTYKVETDKIDDETIKRLNNAIGALEKENEYLKRENETLKAQLATMQTQIDKSIDDIKRLTDLTTNRTAIQDVKNQLEQFKFIIPMMTQFQASDAQQQKDHSEIREMIQQIGKELQYTMREEGKAGQRVTREEQTRKKKG